jgi:hypothetical protein
VTDESYVVDYPFRRSLRTDPLGLVLSTWMPGPEPVPDGPEDHARVYDGMGKVIYTVISRHRPGKYPMRVFYLRRYTAPDGTEFGSPRLKVTTFSHFRTLLRGYRFPCRPRRDGEST